jgi:tetratricopeptide (TPR) repeat protein
MSRLWAITLIMLSLSCAPVFAGPHEEVTNYLVRGNRYMEDGDLERALGKFKDAVDYVSQSKVESEFPIVYFNRGRCYERMRHFPEAIDDYSKAIELQPDYLLAYYNRGVIYQKIEKNDLALADYCKMIELDPNSVHGYNNRGLVLTAKGMIPQAIGDFTKAIDLDPKAIHVHLNRGLAYLYNKDYVAAKVDFSREYELCSSLDADWLYMAIDYFLQRKFIQCRLIIDQMRKKNFVFAPVFIDDLETKLAESRR